jgi:hypothetical protein
VRSRSCPASQMVRDRRTRRRRSCLPTTYYLLLTTYYLLLTAVGHVEVVTYVPLRDHVLTRRAPGKGEAGGVRRWREVGGVRRCEEARGDAEG